MLYIDLETFSSTPIDAGVYRYSESPDFQILMAAWSLDGSPVMLAEGEDAVRRIPGLWDPAVRKVAHNAQFERICLSRLKGLPQGEFLPPAEWIDTQAIAAERGYPQSLKKLAEALGADPKDEAGTRLIRLFSVPQKDGRRITAKDRPAEWKRFCAYCVQDVETLIDVHERLGDFPTAAEERIFLTDQAINDRGIKLDVQSTELAQHAAERNHTEAMARMSKITGLENPNSQQQLLGWLQNSGLPLPDLTADTVADQLEHGDLTDEQRAVLEDRQLTALAATRKFTAMLNAVCDDGILRGQFKFFGAHTGRWSGRGVQLHNLPRAQAEYPEAVLLDLSLGLGASPQDLKGLVRSLLVGPFCVADYSAIEARVVAWLAGEEWALDAFRAGRDIYVETAERMGGLTRAQGKVAVLALGYNGAVASLRNMGAVGTDAELRLMVKQWRRANPRIVELWDILGDAFRYGGEAGRLRVETDGADRLLFLPSGRPIVYHKVLGGSRLTFASPKGFRADTYGGRLCENATQAVARDLLGEALVRLEDAGLAVVGHVHDEVLVEAGEDDLETVERIMCAPTSWSGDLPIACAGFYTYRYKKG